MLELATGLSSQALQAIAGLEQEVIAADGGRLKLEWGTLRSRKGNRVEDVSSWAGDRLDALLALGFGQPAPAGIAERLESPTQRTVIVELDGSAVGTLRLERSGDDASIYGFVVDPAWQGRGIGRAALRLACEQLRADGARRIGLEVDVENDRALSLYTSVGFTPLVTEDYYALPLS